MRTIYAATSSIRVAAYVFTSPDVTRALVAAKQRGVDVAVVADHRSNLEEARSTAGRHALTLIAKTGTQILDLIFRAQHQTRGRLRLQRLLLAQLHRDRTGGPRAAQQDVTVLRSVQRGVEVLDRTFAQAHLAGIAQARPAIERRSQARLFGQFEQ